MGYPRIISDITQAKYNSLPEDHISMVLLYYVAPTMSSGAL